MMVSVFAMLNTFHCHMCGKALKNREQSPPVGFTVGVEAGCCDVGVREAVPDTESDKTLCVMIMVMMM